ncbi:MAG: PAS domain-containing sensor histidine kinase [Bacteroides sp.]|nr:PAS domain-containing sensor histidine kinase [Bacteroides sp.]MBQ8874962.1 PAS domain-containing sensor histidine kinase [Bacteroides sp.]
MKLKSFFFLLAFLLMVVWIILLFIATQENGWRFYLIEGIITFSLVYLVYFYKKVIKPLNSIAGGMDLLQAQDFSSRLSPVGQREADRIVSIFNRMMNQLKEERLRLREQNHFLDLLISVSPMGVIILTLDEQISMVNKAALKFLDAGTEDDVLNKTMDKLTGTLAEELDRMPKDTTTTVRLSDSRIYRCSRLSFVDRGFAHPFYLIESLTSEVMKAEKKAYEKVIRMIAHEVNNSVAGITSTLDTVDNALQTMEDTEDLREVMKVCIERSYSMSRFITNFADVVKIPEPQTEEVCLNDRVIACKRFMENVCQNRNISLRLELCEENPVVSIDTSLFEQVIINIIKNSAESIGEAGEIIIRTSASPSMLEIGDTGQGISKDVEAKLFSPFFSTKPNGQGIGLIFIREVLMKHHCTFSLRTYPDGITRFRICF